MKKTKFEVTIETSEMAKIVPEEYIGKMDECPKDEVLTDEVESAIHQHYFDYVKKAIENGEAVFEAMDSTGHEDVLCPEGIEELKDFGNIKVNIRKVE